MSKKGGESKAKKEQGLVDRYFRELHGLTNNEDEEDIDAIIEVVDKILAKRSTDVEALQTKVCALIRNGEYDDALAVLELLEQALVKQQKKKSKNKPDEGPTPELNVDFERAYCLYRLNRLEECLAVLDKLDKCDGGLHLRAQVYTRLRKYAECSELYDTHFGAVEDAEVMSNVIAAHVSAGEMKKASEAVEHKAASSSYEAVYNYACGLVDDGQYEAATKELERAASLCQSSLEADEFTQEEIDDELSVIRVQQGYLYQREGLLKEARRLYLTILAQKPSDLSVIATANNNIVSLRRGDEKLFDSLKKSDKALRVPQHKLSLLQKRIIHFNRCLLFIHGRKPSKAKEEFEILKQECGGRDDDLVMLVRATLLLRENKYGACVNELSAFVKDHGDNASPEIFLCLAHAQLAANSPEDAVATLQSVETLNHYPATVAVITAILEKQGKLEAANDVFDAATKHWDEQADKNTNVDLYRDIVKENNAMFKMRTGKINEAVALFDELVQGSKDEHVRAHFLGSLVVACAKAGDVVTSQKYEKDLPALEGVDSVDVEALIKNPPRVRRSNKQQQKQQQQQQQQDRENEEMKKKEQEDNEHKTGAIEKKKKKKRKIRWPKGFDPKCLDSANPPPGPDPERWIPKWERSNYKKKRGKGRGRHRHSEREMRGPQGSMPTSDQQTTATEDAPPKQQQQQQQQQQSGRSRRKKKGGRR